MTISTGNFGKALKEGRKMVDKNKKKELRKGPKKGYYKVPQEKPHNPAKTHRTKKGRNTGENY